jgi:hypothetical protein
MDKDKSQRTTSGNGTVEKLLFLPCTRKDIWAIRTRGIMSMNHKIVLRKPKKSY